MFYHKVILPGSGGLTVVFYEYDSDFNGNDFEYKYFLGPGSADIFLRSIPQTFSEPKAAVEEWLAENINCNGTGGDLLEKWIRMGLHGSFVVSEDYPGGIYRKEVF